MAKSAAQLLYGPELIFLYKYFQGNVFSSMCNAMYDWEAQRGARNMYFTLRQLVITITRSSNRL